MRIERNSEILTPQKIFTQIISNVKFLNLRYDVDYELIRPIIISSLLSMQERIRTGGLSKSVQLR